MGGDLVFRRLHLGVEGEYAASHLGWEHLRSPTGRTFSVALKEESAYSARIGLRLAAGGLIYARYGQARARFVTGWVKGGNRDNDVDRDDRKRGRRWGVGMELPLGKHGLLRSEYTLTSYDDYTFTTSHDNADTMAFDNDVATYRMGLGIRF
jgi:opacity protein-like surface antigen